MDERVTETLSKFRDGHMSRQELLQTLFEFITENPIQQQSVIGLLRNENDGDFAHVADGIMELIGARTKE